MTCFVTRAGFRRRGISHALARAAVDFARERGARALEGYPMITQPGKEITWGELHVGSRSIFAAAGFTEVSHPTPAPGRDAHRLLGGSNRSERFSSSRHEVASGGFARADPTTTEEERWNSAPSPSTGIPAAELQERRERLLEHVRRDGLSGYVLFGADYIQYFTGFWFLSNERPVIYAESVGGESAVFVPEFEVERTRAETAFARIESYPEYPGIEHPMPIFARVLADLGIRDAIGADQDGYPGILGYKGPALSDAAGASVAPLGDVIEGMMARKSESEIALIRESGRWCAHAHRLLQEYSRPGATEAEASLRAGQETTLAMLEALGDAYGGGLSSSSGASAGYRGQIGLRSSWAHAVAHNIEFRAGDVLVTETSAPIWGYNAELERAMIIGPPTDEMRRLFDHTVAAQQVAFDAIRPGRHLRRRGRRRHALLRAERPAPVLAPAHRPRDRPAQPRGALPRRRRPHDARAGHGLHRSSRASTTRRSAASVTRTPSSSPRTEWTSSPTTRATSRASRSRSDAC